MTEQMTMEEFFAENPEPIKVEPIEKVEDNLNGLTDRQKALHNFYVEWYEKYRSKATDSDILENMDDEWYGFFAEVDRKNLTMREAMMKFNDLTARRELTKDKEALEYHTGITKVFVGNGYAVTDWEIKRQIIKYNIQGKRAFRKKEVCILKGLKNNQLSFDYGDQGRENAIKVYQSKIAKYDIEIEDLMNQLKEGDKQEKELLAKKNDTNYKVDYTLPFAELSDKE